MLEGGGVPEGGVSLHRCAGHKAPCSLHKQILERSLGEEAGQPQRPGKCTW